LRGGGWPRALAPSALALALLGAAAFAVIPRVDPLVRRSPIVASLGLDKLTPRSSAVSGFTKSVSLGYFGELRRSSARVMRVRPLASVGAAPQPLYVRGLAFDAFDGLRWSRTPVPVKYRLGDRLFWSKDGAAPMPSYGGALRVPGAGRPDPAVSAEYSIFPMNLSVVFSAYPPSAVEAPGASAFLDHTDSANFTLPYTAGIRYTVRGRREAASEGALALAADPQEILRLYLRVPPGEDPRVKDLALRITAGVPGDLAKARAVEKYLRSAYGYSLLSGGEGSGLSDFLFAVREGNCEYFATAAAVLLRHAGVPSRLVSGFLADNYNEYGRFYDVRQSQAHAWTEAYIRGRGWVPLDATPAGAQSAFWGRRFAGRLARWAEAGSVNWYRHVIGYDNYAQRNTFHRLGLAVSRWNLLRALGWLAGAAAGLLLLRALWLARPRGGRRQAALDIFSRAQAALGEAGLPREPWQTPREYAASVAAIRPDLAGIARLAEQHYLERYAGLPRGAADLAEARALLAGLRSRAGSGMAARLRRGFWQIPSKEK
ncbi:MAG: transglutaminase TgpA family protein, partial [Elusimicrobiales bacterium]